MEQGSCSSSCSGFVAEYHEDEFTKLILSWPLHHILDQHVYKNKVGKIPLTFESEDHYFGSFVYPLLEETRCDLASSMEVMDKAPFADILSFSESKSGENMLYNVSVGSWNNKFSTRGRDDYCMLLGDLVLLVDGLPESVSDLKCVGRTWALSVVKSHQDGITSLQFKVKASQPIKFQDGMFAVFLTNIASQRRIWKSLHMHRNLRIIKEILYSDSKVEKKCGICSFGYGSMVSQKLDPRLLLKLNESQRTAVMAALCKIECCHISSVEQISGPPGTGKTMTVSVLIVILLQMTQKTLTCGPTNVAIVELASRVLSLVRESFKTTTSSGDYSSSVGDLLLFGKREIMKVSTDIEEIYLEHRIKRLAECLGPVTGWKDTIRSMIDLLENCVHEYYNFLENEFLKDKKLRSGNEGKRSMLEIKSFIEFVQEQFISFAPPLRRCICTFCTHVPVSFMGEYNFQNMISLMDSLSSLEYLLFKKNLVSEELEDIFNCKPLQDDVVKSCIYLLRTLQISLEGLALPCFSNKYAIKQFCFERASIIFCTTSSSYKLHAVNMEPFNILVIDEAAQLKEAESTIPLQLPGMKHAILIGDERQLPATVKSNVCIQSGFGRSLFERLSSLGHSVHLLSVQYRMHPSISIFPNLKFYKNKVLDAQNVLSKSYEKSHLSGPMFSSYSFINVVGGREELEDDGKSPRNMVEVAIVIKIVKFLYRAWQDSKKKLSVGVISPYAAQVISIQEKLGHKYEKLDGFSVKVKSIDGFQGGEEDIIILSTVRTNSHGSVGFLSCPQRTNVALTRARYCLWILGNEKTLTNSESIWKELVSDARNRDRFFDADADECLKMIIVAAMKELEQLDDLVNGNSVLFKHAKWKVLFSDDFRRSFRKLTGSRLKKQVLNLLLKLSSGWRPKNRSTDFCCKSSSQILKQFKVEGFYVVCTNDIIKEVKYIQVLKVWDVLALDEIPKLTKRLESIFSAYTDVYIRRCTEKCLEGTLEVSKTWPASEEIIRFRYLSECENESEGSVNPGDARIFVENSKVSESLLLMKFYSFSHGIVSHLLSGKEVDLPMQVNDEQMDIILSPKSSFIIGQSGTGKTTILTMKLFQCEQKFRIASDGIYEGENNRFRGDKVLHQLFVTVSPKLCYAVKQNVSHLTSVSSVVNSSAEINHDDMNVITPEVNDIPDTFANIPVSNYPLVMTFQKFLMMLDGTLSNSFFERFLEAREGYYGNRISSRSVALQTFIRLREVTFDRFCSFYWPHFNSKLTKKLDPSRVFTEIISHIKGGLQAGECSDGKLGCDGYCLLAESRSSTLTREKREIVYTIYETYEKMKTQRGEFDLGDLVNDIHHRLENGNYEGEKMDLVYIDEVQDLSMRQISLFKYICQNVDEGFIFAGDTAQTIARGIDFRFQDIRSLFYKEFLSTRTTDKQEKGFVSEIKQLKQNFRTHAGVLDLAQSVIDIIYHYFIHSIDKLEPEISLISGEAPVLLESGSDENAIVTIFGDIGTSGKIAGFGADQVILVRDDGAKTEICEYVGKNALVLTILECKGLEFHDVLLYNFFGTSPLKDQWRVLYGYMKKHNLLNTKLPQSFPTFSEARHSVLCSELKQLYVAITRTRQRLWICESKEDISKPMFDYWKMKGLVQVRELDDSVAQAMRVASSPQEWLDRGKKFFYENNFVMSTLCFEKAGDTMWEKLAKASGLRESAYQMRGTNHEAFVSYVREAAGIFESIGKLESAASCYCDLGDYERAGNLYLYTSGKIDEAAECFTLSGRYSEAAEAYAKGDQFSNCLSVCTKGKLFDKGLEYIKYWKEHFNIGCNEIRQIEEFLEKCALYYHEHKDSRTMRKFVRAFCSLESKRVFLKSLGCLDDLLLLEEELGHFLEAAELARSWGDILMEADLLEKAGNFKDATVLLLWYVFFSSLWGNGNRGWPLKRFVEKEELCNRVKSLAKMDSDSFYSFVCNELNVLSDQRSSLTELKTDLDVSQQNKSLRGNFLSIRKILDVHFYLSSSKYEWGDELPIDTSKLCEDKVHQNWVSVRTLISYWNLWKENVVNIFSSLGIFHNEEPNKYEGHVDFSLIYFGVRKQCVNGNTVYLLVNNDADWIKNYGQKGVHKDGKLLTIDIPDLVFAIRSYWQSELLSVGIKVLETLERLLHMSKSNGSAFQQSTSLLHIFEVTKFLLDCEHLNLTPPSEKKLQIFLKISTRYFDLVFPLDWRNSVSKDLISLRETDLSVNLLNEIILQCIDINGDLTHRTMGRVMMIYFSCRQPLVRFEMVMSKIQNAPSWKSLLVKFWNDGQKNIYVSRELRKALEDTFKQKCKCCGLTGNSISFGMRILHPQSLMYLLDHLVFFVSLSSEIIFTTRSSLVGWLTSFDSTATLNTSLSVSKQTIPDRKTLKIIIDMVKVILFDKEDIVSWISRSKIDASYFHPILALKGVMILSLLGLKESDCSQELLSLGKNCSQELLDLLSGGKSIAELLPNKFVANLLSRREGSLLNLNAEVVSEAFLCIEDPLLIVCSGDANPNINAPCAIFVDLTKSKEEIMSQLFSTKPTLFVQNRSMNDGCETSPKATCSDTSPVADLIVNPVDGCKGELQTNSKVLDEISAFLNGEKEKSASFSCVKSMIQKEYDRNLNTLATALRNGKQLAREDLAFIFGALSELQTLSEALRRRPKKEDHSVSEKTLQEVLKWLQTNTPKINDIMNGSPMSQDKEDGKMLVSENSNTAEVEETSEKKKNNEEKGDDDSSVKVVGNESCDGNSQEVKSKKGKGNNKKGKKGKGKK